MKITSVKQIVSKISKNILTSNSFSDLKLPKILKKDVFEKTEKLMPAKVPEITGNTTFKKIISAISIIVKNKGLAPVQSDFSDEASLITYAKSRIIPRLKAEIPHEYEVVAIKGDKDINVLREFVGDQEKCCSLSLKTVGQLKDPNLNVITMHGHPSCVPDKVMTTPVSLNDFFVMNSNEGEKTSIVFNELGEYSLLAKTDDFKKLDAAELKHLDTSYVQFLLKKLATSVKNGNTKMPHSTIEPYKVDPILGQYISDFQTTEDGIYAIHEFWQQNAPKIGLTYKTNYNYFER